MITSSNIALYAMANRLRGTKLAGATESTTVSRIVACAAMASVSPNAIGFAVLLIGLWLAFLPAWGRYLGAIVNNAIPDEKEVWVIDAIVDKVALPAAVWGALAMCLRFALFVPVIAAYAWAVDGSYLVALGAPLMGVACYPFKGMGGKGWALAEYAYGAVLGILIGLV